MSEKLSYKLKLLRFNSFLLPLLPKKKGARFLQDFLAQKEGLSSLRRWFVALECEHFARLQLRNKFSHFVILWWISAAKFVKSVISAIGRTI